MMAMFRLPAWSVSPATRVAVGLVSLMLSILLLVDLFVPGFLADRAREAQRYRAVASQLLASEVAQAIQSADARQLQPVLGAGLRREASLRAVTVVSAGAPVASAGDPGAGWTLAESQESSLEQVRVRLLADAQPWGELRLVFHPVQAKGVAGWLAHPVVRGTALMVLLALLGFQLYIRRAMRYLDPESAVPERVRTAFDTLAQAVVVLDTQGRIMLTNQVFRALPGAGGASLVGQRVETLRELHDAVQRACPRGLPWDEVLAANRASLGHEIRLGGQGRGERHDLVMNCSPIHDGGPRARGCLLTFSDVTELHERNEDLRVAMDALSVSTAEIESQHLELQRLATRDSLTGCLNRRAFMAEADKLFAKARAQGTPLACVMCDIDHFKSVNDRFGHAAGDQVIQAAAKALDGAVRLGAIVGRYGGEEFCLMIDGVSLQQALDIGERLRAEVQATLGGAMREHAGVVVTMSFGVAPLEPDSASPAALIDFADQALYHSKQTGRNRVTSWPAVQAQRALATPA